MQAAIDFLKEEIQRETEFQNSDEAPDQGNPIPELKKMLDILESGYAPTLDELDAWSFELYKTTVGDNGYGDTDFSDGIKDSLIELLEINQTEEE